MWQIAGDLLPGATREQKIATGFHRNHMINFEGGAIPEEYQAQYIVGPRRTRRRRCFWARRWGARKCHDHKYDPLRQKDFYRMAAFFNTVPEKGLDGQKGNAAPVLALPSEAQEKRLKELKAAMAARAEVLDPLDVAIAQAVWERGQLEAVKPEAPREGLTACYELDGGLGDSSGRFLTGSCRRGTSATAGRGGERGGGDRRIGQDPDSGRGVGCGQGVHDGVLVPHRASEGREGVSAARPEGRLRGGLRHSGDIAACCSADIIWRSAGSTAGQGTASAERGAGTAGR